MNRNAYNHNLLIAVTHWVEKTDWSGRQFGPIQPYVPKKYDWL